MVSVEVLDNVLAKLNLHEFFPDIDKDLIRLAITVDLERHQTADQERTEFMQVMDDKYIIGQGGEGNGVLAFYGDIALSVIVADRMKNYFGLNTDKSTLNKIKEELVKNKTLSWISIELGFCGDLYESPSLVTAVLHNPCGESIEGILGALLYTYGLEGLPLIKQWFFSLEPVKRLFDELLFFWYERQQKNLVGSKYFPVYVFSATAPVEDFLEAYSHQDDNHSIVMEEDPNNSGEYLASLVDSYHNRALHLGRFEKGDNEGLKAGLIKIGVWVPPKQPRTPTHMQSPGNPQPARWPQAATPQTQASGGEDKEEEVGEGK